MENLDGDDSATDSELDADAELVALRLADGQSHAEAAMGIGRGAKWVQRRLATDPAFRKRVDELKAARVHEAAAGLGALLGQAVEVVARNLDAERPADQLRAAALAFDRSRQFRGDAEMAQQVDMLKAEVAELRALVEAVLPTSGRSS